ncbi:hypothetical protein AVEN_209951-1 [Araneus ventricosus]|uniref:Uncharacterized protein n=1 Tax=Araneus ventricosus TaxID=182803 RepID=A0A4Y2DBK7_ARAVE|nr:hypothetical protein AVEN_209951-1 [Araneus ventricosus]
MSFQYKHLYLTAEAAVALAHITIAATFINTIEPEVLVARSRLRDRRSQVRNPIPLKIRRVWDLLHAKSCVVAKRPPAGVARKFGKGGVSSGVVLVI